MDVIWILKAGIYIDSSLSDSCYWYRLNEKVFRKNDYSSHLSKFYYQQYKDWRDNAIDKAEDLLKREEKDVAILSMDIKRCYYCTDINFSTLKKELKNNNEILPGDKKLVELLTEIISKIHEKYNDKVQICKEFHEHSEDCKTLPIGLISSGILCNWYLKKFDKKILEILNPAYYGRYVDDILIVIKNPVISYKEPEKTVEKFLYNNFVKKRILKKEDDTYSIIGYDNLKISLVKTRLYELKGDYSLALLEKYKKKIEQNSSFFHILPVKESDFDLEKNAYDLFFDGSSNKLRNIVGFSENPTELSINLSKLLSVYSSCDCKKDDLIRLIKQISNFFIGKNYLYYCRLWEKIFAATIVTHRYHDTYELFENINQTINNITFKTKNEKTNYLTNQLNKDLRKYLFLSLSLSLGLLGKDIDSFISIFKKEYYEKHVDSSQFDVYESNLNDYSQIFRDSNLIKHYYVALPLTNYTDYDGSLVDINKIEEYLLDSDNIKIDAKKIENTPRFIQFSEYQQYSLFTKLYIKEKSKDDKHVIDINEPLDSDYLKLIDEYFKKILLHENLQSTDYQILMNEYYYEFIKDEIHQKIKICDNYIERDKYPKNDEKNKIKIGVANIQINNSEIQSSFRKGKKPNLSIKRRRELHKLLNLAEEENCDLFVLPELSVPYRWLPFMINYSRTHQIGLIFGMEYWIINKKMAYNFIVTILPIRDEDNYRKCCLSIRCKNHYSPKEIDELERNDYDIPKFEYPLYHLLRWKGIQFTTYNCYELTDILHRSIFKEDLDFLVACVLNRDVNYFSNIIESVAKDLHCYVVQVNCSEYGDSRIVQPTNSEQMNILRVTGGKNKTILTAIIDIDKLRDFQALEYRSYDKRFKPVPAGFNRNNVHKRGKLEK